jgi:endonuclease YncB( thermonuclease family)
VSGGTADQNLSQQLDRHNIYVRRGWVVPGDSAMRGHQILGRVLSARQNSARTLYETAAAEMNNFLWDEIVTDESKQLLELTVTDPMFDRIGITDPRQLWERWNTNRDKLIDDLLIGLDVERGSEEEAAALDGLRDFFRISEREQAWSTEWRGDDIELFSARAREFPVLFNEQTRYMAAVMGLDVREGMTGEDFINNLIAYRSQAEGGAWNAVRYNYTEYQDTRGRGFAVAQQTLTDLTQNPSLNPSWRGQLDEYVQWAGSMGDRNFNEGGVTRDIQEEAVDRFNRLATAGRDAPVNWDKIWRDGFQSSFGPRDWTAPEPRQPLDEDGEMVADAWLPYIRSVVDGDTLEVSRNRGPGIIEFPLRPEAEEGQTRVHKVRILGVNAEEYGVDPDLARTHQRRLEQALTNALRNGDSIYLVRDPGYAGTHTDPFGRELAWLWIGDQPFYFPDELERGS